MRPVMIIFHAALDSDAVGGSERIYSWVLIKIYRTRVIINNCNVTTCLEHEGSNRSECVSITSHIENDPRDITLWRR